MQKYSLNYASVQKMDASRYLHRRSKRTGVNQKTHQRGSKEQSQRKLSNKKNRPGGGKTQRQWWGWGEGQPGGYVTGIRNREEPYQGLLLLKREEKDLPKCGGAVNDYGQIPLKRIRRPERRISMRVFAEEKREGGHPEDKLRKTAIWTKGGEEERERCLSVFWGRNTGKAQDGIIQEFVHAGKKDKRCEVRKLRGGGWNKWSRKGVHVIKNENGSDGGVRIRTRERGEYKGQVPECSRGGSTRCTVVGEKGERKKEEKEIRKGLAVSKDELQDDVKIESRKPLSAAKRRRRGKNNMQSKNQAYHKIGTEHDATDLQ